MDLPKRLTELREKWLPRAVLGLLGIILLNRVVYCATALFTPARGYPPFIMYEDRLYRCPTQPKLSLPEEAVFCGKIKNSVDNGQLPKENFQSNWTIWEGKDIYRISADCIAIQVDEGWQYFDVLTEE